MTESLINSAIDLPEPKTLLTRQLVEIQREELFTRLVEREQHWIHELTTHAGDINPDQDQLASTSSLANAYGSLIPYADPSIQVLSPYNHRNQIITRDTVKERHTVSGISDTDRKELEGYRSLALFFHFASIMAREKMPIKYTQDSHNTCASYWQFYPQRPKPDVTDGEGSLPASIESAALKREEWELWESTLQGLKEYAWVQSGKEKEEDPDIWGLRAGLESNVDITAI